MTRDPLVYLIDPDDDDREYAGAQLKELNLTHRSFSDAESFLVGLQPHRVGCALTELKLGGLTGLQLVKRLRQQGCSIPVVLLTAHATVAITVEAFKTGLFEVLEKPSDGFKLWDCATRAFEEHTEHLIEAHHRNGIRNRISQLSQQEFQVMQMVLAGQPNKRIATTLGLSPRTIVFRRKSLMEKMNAKSVGELACLIHSLANGNTPGSSSELMSFLDDHFAGRFYETAGTQHVQRNNP